MVMGVVLNSGKSPPVPAQKDCPQIDIVSLGIVVSGDVDMYFLKVAVCVSSRRRIHGRVWESGSVTAFQSRLHPKPFMTTGCCPNAG